MVKHPPANIGDIRDVGSILGSGRSLGGGYGNSVQYSCLDNPRDRGDWWAIVLGVAKSHTQLKQLSMHMHACSSISEKQTTQLKNCQKT